MLVGSNKANRSVRFATEQPSARRSVCAPRLVPYCTADPLKEPTMIPFLSVSPRNTKRLATGDTIRTNRRRAKLSLETLEDRRLLASVIPNDPNFPNQWPLHNTGQTGGLYDSDIDMPEAWSVATGSTATV